MKEVVKLGFKTKAKMFIKKYGYYCLLGVAVVALGLTIALVNVNSAKKPANVINKVSSDAIVFALPVSSGDMTLGYSDTELQYNDTLKCWKAHLGLDYTCDAGTDVLAAFDGTVKSVTTDELNGTVIVIEHSDGLQSVYGSLNKNVQVSVGDFVNKSQPIAKVANTALNEYLEGSHLHFEVLKDELNVDPSLYVSVK